jgi:glycyl-tRNA synthetase beta chain
MYEKVERIRAAAAAAAEQVGLPDADRVALDRAALLCKADLTTEVVSELPSLQGAMGREYALASGEPSQVADAIGEHYRPRFAGDSIPSTQIGRLLALSDKLDTLAALFAIGVVPSGSTDPFGLRREAYGVVNILVATSTRLSISSVVSAALFPALVAALSDLDSHVELDWPVQKAIAAVVDFLRDRLAVSLREDGIRYDLVEAALAAGVDDLHLAAERARALQQLSTDPDFLPTVVACTRPMNISKTFEGGDVDPSLFAHDSERRLWDAYQRVLAEAESANLVELFKLFADHLRAPIDTFFDDVLVMAEDEALRRNRLALCWNLSQLFRRLADFTLIVQT